MTMLQRFLLDTAVPLAIAVPLLAHAQAQAKIGISQPWARETAPGQAAGGGFLTITNSGTGVDKLVGGTTPVARQLQIHNMTMDGGIMRMRQLTDGLAIPAGGTVVLKPGSYHLMFMGLTQPLKAGTKVPVTLEFQRAGKVQVSFIVQPMMAPAMPNVGPGMGAMEHHHGGH